MKTLHIYHSDLVNIPILGYCLIILNVFLLKLTITNVFFTSTKTKFFQKHISIMIEKNLDYIYCHSTRIGFNLSFFSRPIELCVNSAADLKINSSEKYQNILFSFTFAQKLSAKSRKIIKKEYGQLFLRAFR